jgi:thiol-disulfide isomerase/thioredoxin
MDVSVPDRPLRRIAWGALEGVVLGAVVYGAASLIGEVVPAYSWRWALGFVGVGMSICAAAQAIAGGILGACAGLVVVAVLSFVLSDEFARPTLSKRHLNQPARLEGKTLEGEEFNISSYRGKVVLVDFWATWCVPCRYELPGLMALYKQYHDAGLEIVGVSLDESREDVVRYVKREEIPWPQLFSEREGERGSENPLAQQYMVNAIPNMLLIDREGKLIAAGPNLTGSMLERAVEKALAGESPPSAAMMALADPITLYFAAIGCLVGMLVERRLRQVWSGAGEGAPS